MKRLRQLKARINQLSLKKTYYLMLLVLIGFPLFLVFIVSFVVLDHQYKEQAVENIRQMQQSIISELTSDIDEMAMRMTTMLYANDYELLRYAADSDTVDETQKYRGREELEKMSNLYLVPDKQTISLYFIMNDGTDTYLKTYVTRKKSQIETSQWYKDALTNKNKVYIGCYDTKSNDDLFRGGKKDMFILIGVISPGADTDKSGKIKMAELYQTSGIADRIKENNRAYLAGENTFGILQITDESGNCLFQTEDGEHGQIYDGTMCIRSPINVYGSTWYIENYVRPSELTEKFQKIGLILLVVTIVIFLLLSYYSSYFIKSIVKPIGDVNKGLHNVENGNLDVYIKADGQYEIRKMIYQFNAMVRQLKFFFQEYETKLKSERNDSFYYRELMAERMSPAEVGQEYRQFFKDPYTIIGLYIYGKPDEGAGQDKTEHLLHEFLQEPRYASRCCAYIYSPNEVYLLYRIIEHDYRNGLRQIINNLQNMTERKYGREIFACEGKKCGSPDEFRQEADRVKLGMRFRFLFPKREHMTMEDMERYSCHEMSDVAEEIKEIVSYAFRADEKNMILKRDHLLDRIRECTLPEMKKAAFAVVMFSGEEAALNNDSMINIFGTQYNYVDKIERLEDEKSIRMWILNFFNWILDYSKIRFRGKENDMTVTVKRYIQDHYDDPELSLKDIAAYAGLNEKYVSSRFTKEAGETITAYLTEFRIQKAKEILKTTDFKIYEVAEMTGYHSVEHFNKVFKKIVKITPGQYRKQKI